MKSKVISIDRIEGTTKLLKPNYVMNMISLTTIILMIFFAWKLITLLIFAGVSLINNEIVTVIACCLSINIVAYIFIRRYMLIITYMEKWAENKSATLQHANGNLRFEIAERKQAEANLRISEGKYRALIDLPQKLLKKLY